MPGSSFGTSRKLDVPAPLAVRDDFGHRIRKAAGADVVDHQDRVVRTHRPAAVDDFLGAALHLRIAALHRGEIELFAARAAALRRRRAAAEADQHRRTAEQDEAAPTGTSPLLHMHAPDVAETARDHDRLVIAANDAWRIRRQSLFEAAEVAEDAGAAEFVVEGRCADRPVEHDVERRGDARRTAVVGFPRLRRIPVSAGSKP